MAERMWSVVLTWWSIAFFLTFLLTLVLILTKSIHGRFSFDRQDGVQRFHESPTPRIGGLAIFLGFILTVGYGAEATAPIRDSIAWPALLAAVPAFVFGLAEDVTKRVSPISRLLMTMASVFVAWWLTGVSLERIGIPWFDQLLALTGVSVLFTAFAVGGVANAINIIDGFHGLASGVVVIALAAMGVIAWQVGDVELVVFVGLITAGVLGFFVFNFPFGKIFLGDGGAYLLGFLVGWVAVLLTMRNPGVPPWAALLICALPVAETLFSMVRRIGSKLEVLQPDREHLHSLVKTAVVRPTVPHWSVSARNAAVSPFLWVMSLIPALVAVLFYDDFLLLLIGFALFCLAYYLIYGVLKRRADQLSEN